MATPKTPRKRAVKAQDESAGKPPVDATTETGLSVSDAPDRNETGPSKVEPTKTESSKVEPSKAEPSKVGNAAAAKDADPKNPLPIKTPADAPAQAAKPEPKPEKPEEKSEPFASTKAATPLPPAPVVKSGPGFVPLVLGGVVAAGIGFGLAQYIKPEGWPFPGTATMQDDYAQQAQAIADLRAQSTPCQKRMPATL
ncbi:hypothetical protein [Pseudorhodobacter aquimaris]|uniref:hypothetical protein n=1 Tax=Pseudorhodobacter aquimaris TaxID=687412 RepID=UPI00067D06C1|nr:hypothetical protein [Pseudorhodobacter aquimaris]